MARLLSFSNAASNLREKNFQEGRVSNVVFRRHNIIAPRTWLVPADLAALAIM
ncbi:MAG: hypothetical protein HKP25_03950 [Marinicaulis sp.]|nr:hypothetical protein [Marinicaulis sp.]